MARPKRSKRRKTQPNGNAPSDPLHAVVGTRWLFSQRRTAANEAEEWCIKAGAPRIPFNIVTALVRLGYLK